MSSSYFGKLSFRDVALAFERLTGALTTKTESSSPSLSMVDCTGSCMRLVDVIVCAASILSCRRDANVPKV